MDDRQFDNLTKQLAAGSSRRAFFKVLAGGVAAGLAAVTGAGAAVAARQPNGAACSRATDCASLKCADGLCCNTACAGQCESCASGTCTPVAGNPVGTRPACPGSGPCRATCDGVTRTRCAAWPGGDVACGAATCSGGWLTTSACGGNGSCVPTTTNCAPFGCDASGTACATGCTSHDQCPGESHCAAGVCVGDKALGAACADGVECVHGVCAHGVCCNEPCDGPCQACGADGFCGPAADGTACSGGTCCDGDCIDTGSDVAHCGACHNGCVGDVCQGAVCTGGVCGTQPHPEGTPCDDGSACTTGDACQGGVCAGTPTECPPPAACHDPGACDPATGACVYPVWADGADCDDGDACTEHDACQAGVCVRGNPVVCAPADQCHQAGVCQAATGTCTYVDHPNGTSCNDGDACTQTDTCQAGVCVGSNPISCPTPTSCQASVACNPSNGTCVPVNKQDGTLCGADNACSHDICRGSVCTTDVPKDAGTACNDANACTQTDACDGQGNCVGGAPVVCVAPDACHGQGTCDAGTGSCGNHPQLPGTCFVGGVCYSANDPNPANPCERCDPAASATGFSPRPDDTACAGADQCFRSYACRAGVCAGGDPVVCTALDQCHVAGMCDPATGVCSNPNAADGASCDDGDPATCNDSCQGGVCVGEPCGPPLAVCSPTLTCPPGLICCGPNACYDPVRCDPITGTCAQCRSTCDPLGFEGFTVRVLDPPCSGINWTSLGPCSFGTCQDNQVHCGDNGWELVDGVCRQTCGFLGNYCTEVGTKCCGSQICCSTSTQRCHLGPPPQCIDTCPGGVDPCGSVCCDHFFDPDGDLVMRESCEFGVCRTKCGGTTCDRDTERCCGSRCCDKNTQVCGTAPGTCAPLPTCSSSQVYIPEEDVCCPTILACGDPPSACCNPFTETCHADVGQCFVVCADGLVSCGGVCCEPSTQICVDGACRCADGRDSCGGVCCEPSTQICVDGTCRTNCFPTSCAIGSEICCGGICCDPGTQVCGPGNGNGIGACLPECSLDDTCVGATPNGSPCSTGGQCQSGICNGTSGVCCSQTCGAGVGCTGTNNSCTSPCTPDCTGQQCGSDGCGGLCLCPPGQRCSGGFCIGIGGDN